MKILIGCEESQAVTIEFRRLGHEAFSCDLKPCSGGHPEWHLQMDIFKAIKLKKWDAAIFFPDCTYLTNTANKWYKDQPKRRSGALVGAERREARENAIDFFLKLANCGIPKIAIENPVGVMSTRYRKPNQIVCPTMFGHKEPKKTCLWLKNLPLLESTEKVEPEYHTTKSGKRMPLWYAYADKSKGQEYRAELRSKHSWALQKQWLNNGQILII